MTRPSPLLIAFLKEPAPGKAKTRLGRDIGHEEATRLAWALAEDTLTLLAGAPCPVQLRLTPDQPSPRLAGLLAQRLPGSALASQGEGGLGERLARALAEDHRPRLVVGSDCPQLRSHHLQQALTALDSSDVVVGPASDGGYYLLGLAAGVPAAGLADPTIRWSSAETLADTVRALGRGEPARLEILPDLDLVTDLAGLYANLPALGPAIRAWLEGPGRRFKPLAEQD